MHLRPPLSARLRLPGRELGILLATLALFVQLTAPGLARMQPPAADLATLLHEPGAICHAGSGPDVPAGHRHDGRDGLPCPLCAILFAHVAPLPVSGAAVVPVSAVADVHPAHDATPVVLALARPRGASPQPRAPPAGG